MTLVVTAVVMVSMVIGLQPITVSAADYIEARKEPVAGSTALQLNIENVPYDLYEMMTEEERATQVKVQQFLQQWKSKRVKLNQDGTVMEESMSIVYPMSIRLAMSEEELQQIEDSMWHHPLLRDTFVTSPFGMRLHPVYGYYRMHYGVDLNGYWGDDIVAARTGTVIDTGYNDSAGYYIEIDHGDGFVTEYMHLSEILVDEGQMVKGGELIGYVGSTGASTGAHLHFGMLLDDEYVDPEDYIEFE